MSWKAETHPQLLIPISVLLQCSCVGYVSNMIVIILALDSPSLADCWLVERESMCRDQIVTSFGCVTAFGIPRHIHCLCSTVMALLCSTVMVLLCSTVMALLCIPVFKLVSRTFSTRHIHCSCSTVMALLCSTVMALLCIPVFELVSRTFYTIPIFPFCIAT